MNDKRNINRISIDVTEEQLRICQVCVALNGKSLAQFILDVVLDIPQDEMWLFEPQNKEALESLQKGLRQRGEKDGETIKKRLQI